MNPYTVGNLPNTDPRLLRVLRDLAERNNQLAMELESVRREIPAVGAKKENPIEGILTIPSPAGDGFVRVSKDGAIKSYGSPARGGYIIPLFLSSQETLVTSSSETDLRVFKLAPNTLSRDSDHLVYQAGGFIQAAGGNITLHRFRGRLQTISNDVFFDSQDITQVLSDGEVANWHVEGRIARNDTNNVGDLAVVFHWWKGATQFFLVGRAEISPTNNVWANELTFKLTTNVTISAGTGSIVSETFSLYKHSMG